MKKPKRTQKRIKSEKVTQMIDFLHRKIKHSRNSNTRTIEEGQRWLKVSSFELWNERLFLI